MPTDTDASRGNLDRATADMKLTPQEQNLYQHHLNNLWGDGGVNNADGSRSTVYQTVEKHGDAFYNIPTVWNGKKEIEPWTRPEDGKTFDVPNATALANVEKAGWDQFPSYADPDTADARYGQMHGYMEQDTMDYLNSAGTPGFQQWPNPEQ